jgi:hypothetical protein
MKILTLTPHYELEILQQSDSSFRIVVRYDDRKAITHWYLGTIYGNYLNELTAEGPCPHWSVHFYLELKHPISIPEKDFKRMMALLKSNNLIKEPAQLLMQYVLPYDFKDHASVQIGRLYDDDPDPYPELDVSDD